jgi:hypothetical protein
MTRSAARKSACPRSAEGKSFIFGIGIGGTPGFLVLAVPPQGPPPTAPSENHAKFWDDYEEPASADQGQRAGKRVAPENLLCERGLAF